MNDTTPIADLEQSGDETSERVLNAARAASQWEVVPHPSGRGVFARRIRAARVRLAKLEQSLAHWKRLEAKPDSTNSALQELRANPRLLRSAILALADQERNLARLPRVVAQGKEQELRVVATASAYVEAVQGGFSAQTFRSFVAAYQTHEAFTVNELWILPVFVRFVLLESIMEQAEQQLRLPDSALASTLSISVKSLQAITNADLVFLIESLIQFDAILKQDPDGTYARMDFESRELYRKRIAYAAQNSDCTEIEVARKVLELALEGGAHTAPDPRIQRRLNHVGYYLVGDGFKLLAQRIGFHPPISWSAQTFVRAHGEDFYITGIQLITILILAVAVFPLLPRISNLIEAAILLLLLVIPVTQAAVELINSATTSFFEPQALPKLDFSKSIPLECTTLVTVPTLLLDQQQVRGLVTDVEVRYLANRDPNLHFALLTDLADSMSKPRENDAHPLVELATRLINELNERYSKTSGGSFILLHRHRVFNGRQGVWMGWERKRGKLLDLNKLLAGEFDAFPIKAGHLDALRHVRYIVTLDSDTELPRGTAAKLIGAIAHPLNQAVIDPKLRIVTEGYGILQPRIGIAVSSTARSRLATIYQGQSGFDIYTRAFSDAYQDLFGEGIFTGKGIYEAKVLHAVLNRRFPRNALLSHDLIEGAYARAGLATDIEIIDDYPSHYSAYSRRKHRWVRGDWQILQWMFSRVPDESGRWGRNPISEISKWKIFDNLRRSLVDPFLVFLFVAGWFWLPGGPLYWTVVPLILLVVPALVQFVFGLGRAVGSGYKARVGEAVDGLGHSLLLALFHLIFLPHEMLLALDAIVRSLVRGFITGERLLEWETAAQAEINSAGRTPVDRYLAVMPALAICLGLLVWFCAPNKEAIFCATPILVLWSLAIAVTEWLDRPPRKRESLSASDKQYLLCHALRVWRYFNEFSSERHHYLIPDNVEEEGLYEAARVSPTNIGLLLNARQAACELGFLTVPEFAELTQKTLASIASMAMYRGHLFNWYNTETLEPLNEAPFVSSVDSGNFVASLYTLHSGATNQVKQPLFSARLFAGLHAHWRLIRTGKHVPAPIARLRVPAADDPVEDWLAWLPEAEAALRKAAASVDTMNESGWWIQASLRRIDAIHVLLNDYMPWASPEFAALCAVPQLALNGTPATLSLEESIAFAEATNLRLANNRPALNEDGRLVELGQRFHVAVAGAVRKLKSLLSALHAIADDAKNLAEQTEFAFLVDPNRQILSIGMEAGATRTHEACYDMIASEARIATFLAIARGDLPQQSWFKLARDHAFVYGRFLLLSWTGTMFEYMMPALWMRAYPGTLIARTQEASVHVQRAFTRSLDLPWGISESGAARKDDKGHYHYQAYGVPSVALWVEATAGPVISPYSSFLALRENVHESLRNLRRMEAAGWVGDYGFYESADYTESLRRPALTREWMAHHQGMSLMAIANLLCDDIMQRWFHQNPLVRATELLLHEMPPSKAVMKAKLSEFAPIRDSY